MKGIHNDQVTGSAFEAAAAGYCHKGPLSTAQRVIDKSYVPVASLELLLWTLHLLSLNYF